MTDETTDGRTDRGGDEPARAATVRTTHADAAVVAAALAPDDTDSISVAVDGEGDSIEATIERPTTGGLRSTVDDYVVNLRVADRVIESAGPAGFAGHRSAASDTDTNTDARAVAETERDTSADTDSDTNADTDTNTNTDTDSDTNADIDTNTNT